MKEPSRRTNATIRMGEMSVAADGERLRTLLGSCVGVALHDRRHNVGGLAHIVLPSAQGVTARPGKFVDTAIPALIERMEEIASGGLNLVAKMAGGANMFSATVSSSIGQQNVESCQQVLRELGIPIIGRHCGGDQGRRMLLDTATGEVLIERVGHPPVEL